MPKASVSFTAAFKAHGEGRLQDAERGYRETLKADPRNPEAWHLLGVAAQQQGRTTEAVEHIQKALKISGPKGNYLTNLGISLHSLGRSAEAVDIFEKAASLEPTFLAHFALGNALQSLGRFDEAIARYERALSLERGSAPAHNNLGNAYKALGRLTEAAASYQRALAYQPGHVRAHYNLGTVLHDAGKAKEAAASFRKALDLAPDFAEAHVNLGAALRDLAALDEAYQHLQRAIQLSPQDPAAFNNLGSVLADMGKFEEAIDCYNKAAALRPDLAELRHNEGVALQAAGREEEALERYQHAQHMRPEFADAAYNAALLKLMLGDFKAGWEAYECRWRRDAPGLGFRSFPQPQWEGQGGGGILVWGEQGIGDRVLYASMIPDLLARGHRVVMETEPRLIGLFERSFPGVKAVGKQAPPHEATARPDIQWQSALASLGRWLRSDISAFPRTPYLKPDEARKQEYRRLLKTDHEGPVVGISWISRNPKMGVHKTSELKEWAPILHVPGVRFVDLQYGDTAVERAAVEAELGVRVEHIPDLDLRDDIDGVAALAAACDLVISVSNTTVHLAAALGTPTWVMVPTSVGNLWYWMRGDTPTPWYECVTLFRQQHSGRWSETICRISQSLQQRLQQIN